MTAAALNANAATRAALRAGAEPKAEPIFHRRLTLAQACAAWNHPTARRMRDTAHEYDPTATCGCGRCGR